MKHALIIVTTIICMYACQQPQTTSKGEEPLARAYGESLYISDLKGLVGENTTPADSALIVNNHVQSWLRDRVLAQTAQSNSSENDDIERLVSNYRSSLLLNMYKQELLDNELDTTVTIEELQTYFDENKDKYELQENIAQCMFVKIDRDKPYGKLKRWWSLKRESDYAKLVSLAKRDAAEFHLDTLKWISFDDLEAKLPKGAFKERYYEKKERDIYVKSKNFRHFLRLKKTRRRGKTAPMEYVQDDISKVILKKKKSDLIRQKQEELYQQELDNKNIEIY